MHIRIFTLAKELDIDSKLLIDYCSQAGITIKNSALASISPEERDRVLDVIRQSDRTVKYRIEGSTLYGRDCQLHDVTFLSTDVARGLSQIHLGRNYITRLPDLGIVAKTLTSLVLDGNPLEHVPEQIRQCRRLKCLSLCNTQLRDLPAWIGELDELVELYVSGNWLVTLPVNVGLLAKLTTIDIAHNQFAVLPKTLLKLPRLAVLYLHENTELHIPPEILGSRREVTERGAPRPDAAKILQYELRREKEGKVALREAKIVLVGQGNVGKTSLAKRLVGGKPFDPNESQTHGINVVRWKIETEAINSSSMAASMPNMANLGRQVRKRRQKKWKAEREILHDTSLKANIWDFGGQEIMHSTHQFFLTQRSVYLLLIDARAGEHESNLHYWLQTIRAYGESAPVVIVVNKCEPPHHLDLNEERIKADYRNVVEFHYVSCSTDTGIDQLRRSLERLVKALPHVNDKVPQSYFSIKNELEARSKSEDFITAHEFLRICGRFGVEDFDEQQRLLQLLHDLGAVLHFDDPRYAVHDTNVLNPEWVTTGVYRLIMNHELRVKADGKVRIADLGSIIANPHRFPPSRYSFLIGLMTKFDLCFEFDDNPGTLLVPELLGINEPDVGWIRPAEKGRPDARKDVLNFEIHYGLLPRGLVPRFIVRTHHLLTSTPTYWRSGVLLEIDGCRTLVRGDLRSARVFIQIQGGTANRRRHALTVVRDHFRAIHSVMPRLEAEEKVPLPLDQNAPVVDYEHLRRLQADGETSFLPVKAARRYIIRDLLDGIDERSFDVFLSHNSQDKPAIRDLARVLREQQIRPWVDEDVLLPGDTLQDRLIEGYEACRVLAVCIGPNGRGPWQNQELLVGLDDAAASKKRLIPILLPGLNTDEEPELPGAWRFLKSRHWMDLRSGFADETSISRLVAGIREEGESK